MTFKDGLLRARGQIVFLIGLIVASAIVIRLEQMETVQCPDERTRPSVTSRPPVHAAVHGAPARSAASAEARQAWLRIRSRTLRDQDDAAALLLAASAAHRMRIATDQEYRDATAAGTEYLSRYRARLPERGAARPHDALLIETIALGGSDRVLSRR